ncbi:vitamin K epoxide reductase family protein [Amycolatopsis endophytica]|uniref:Putative membrane protein n=1 Tax=Amycolatopsis endophytica TaxID=860233 RepID=A0A853B9A5_9PSEU|nr:vitamin K epoxide reductase family protein [Amycolatopsis endophytica]NYI91354.1 putative membrane protein [Amycolatopsis endophytica]
MTTTVTAPETATTRGTRHDRGLAWTYLVGGALGLAAAIALTLEELAKLADPAYVPSCSLNPVISCGSVMDSTQAAAFGFPNSLLGVAAFAVVVTTGVAMLAGFSPPAWYRWGMQAGAAFGVVFVHWLIHASLYEIHALCPYCLVVWLVTIPLFFYTTVDNLRRVPATRRAGAALGRLHTAIIVFWYVVIAALVLQSFWDYWITLV